MGLVWIGQFTWKSAHWWLRPRAGNLSAPPSASPGVFLKNLRGGFEEQVTRGPEIRTGALDHEDGHQAVGWIHGQIRAVSAVVAEHAVAQMIAEAVIDLGRSGLFPPQF